MLHTDFVVWYFYLRNDWKCHLRAFEIENILAGDHSVAQQFQSVH